MNRTLCAAISGVSLLLLASCSGVRQIRPLDKGESAATLSVGGPFTKVGQIFIPMPFLSLGYNYGWLKNVDVEAGLHLTSMLYGILDLEGGINWRPLRPQRFAPGLIVSPRLFGMTDFRPHDARLYPDVGLTAYWQAKQHWYVYTGLDNWFEFYSKRADNLPQEHQWLIAPYLGSHFGTSRWMFQTEIKLYTPNLSNFGRPAQNIGIGDHGVIGVFLGVSRYFGGKPL